MKLEWRPMALDDRDRIMDYIALDNPQAALELDTLFEDTAKALVKQPKLYKEGRIKGTREAVVHPNYMLVYKVSNDAVSILRVAHIAGVAA